MAKKEKDDLDREIEDEKLFQKWLRKEGANLCKVCGAVKGDCHHKQAA